MDKNIQTLLDEKEKTLNFLISAIVAFICGYFWNQGNEAIIVGLLVYYACKK